jgi:hypothetical protein
MFMTDLLESDSAPGVPNGRMVVETKDEHKGKED